MNPNKMKPQATYVTDDWEAGTLYAQLISLVLFCAAFIASLCLVFWGIVIYSQVVLCWGVLGCVIGLSVLLGGSILCNNIANGKVIIPKRAKRHTRANKALRLAGYGYVAWVVVGLLLVMAGNL